MQPFSLKYRSAENTRCVLPFHCLWLGFLRRGGHAKQQNDKCKEKNVSRSSHLVFTDNGWTISISAPATVVKIILDGTTSAALWDRCEDRRKWYRTVRSR